MQKEKKPYPYVGQVHKNMVSLNMKLLLLIPKVKNVRLCDVVGSPKHSCYFNEVNY